MILTPHGSHAELVAAALRAGKAVFVEKPLAISLEGLRSILRAIEASGNDRLMVGFNRRFAPLLIAPLRAAMGAAGAAQLLHYRVNAGPAPAEGWHRDRAHHGGRFVGEGCHFVDVAAWWLSARPFGVTARRVGDGPDDLAVTIDFDNGAVGFDHLHDAGRPPLSQRTHRGRRARHVGEARQFHRARRSGATARAHRSPGAGPRQGPEGRDGRVRRRGARGFADADPICFTDRHDRRHSCGGAQRRHRRARSGGGDHRRGAWSLRLSGCRNRNGGRKPRDVELVCGRDRANEPCTGLHVSKPARHVRRRRSSIAARRRRSGVAAKRSARGLGALSEARAWLQVLPCARANMSPRSARRRGMSLLGAASQLLAGRLCALGREWPRRSCRATSFPLNCGGSIRLTGKLLAGGGDLLFRYHIYRRERRTRRREVRLGDQPPAVPPAACGDGVPQRRRQGARRHRGCDRQLVRRQSAVSWAGVGGSPASKIALRAISLLIVSSLLADRLDRGVIAKTRAILSASLFWLARYPSLHSSANNHRIAETAGEHLISLAAPDLPHALRRQRTARRVLGAEALRQFHSDGAPAEQSPTYGAFSAELLLLCHVSAPIAARARAQLDRFADFIFWLADPRGRVPAIGDDD